MMIISTLSLILGSVNIGVAILVIYTLMQNYYKEDPLMTTYIVYFLITLFTVSGLLLLIP